MSLSALYDLRRPVTIAVHGYTRSTCAILGGDSIRSAIEPVVINITILYLHIVFVYCPSIYFDRCSRYKPTRTQSGRRPADTDMVAAEGRVHRHSRGRRPRAQTCMQFFGRRPPRTHTHTRCGSRSMNDTYFYGPSKTYFMI